MDSDCACTPDSRQVEAAPFDPSRHGHLSVQAFHTGLLWLAAPPKPSVHNLTADLVKRVGVYWHDLGRGRALVVVNMEAAVICIGVNRSTTRALFTVFAECKVMVARGTAGPLKHDTEGTCRQRSAELNRTVIERNAKDKDGGGGGGGGGFRYPAKWKCFETEAAVPGCGPGASAGHQRVLMVLVGNGVQAQTGDVNCTAIEQLPGPTKSRVGQQATLTGWLQAPPHGDGDSPPSAAASSALSGTAEPDAADGLFAAVPFREQLASAGMRGRRGSHMPGREDQIDHVMAAVLAESASAAEESSLRAALAASAAAVPAPGDDDAGLRAALALSLQATAPSHAGVPATASAAARPPVTVTAGGEEDVALQEALKASADMWKSGCTEEERQMAAAMAESERSAARPGAAAECHAILIDDDNDDDVVLV